MVPMTLRDTIPLMTSAEYKERFKAEYYQLKIRCEKLQAMLKQYREGGNLPFELDCPYELLVIQLAHMQSYFDVLTNRAKIEKVDLED